MMENVVGRRLALLAGWGAVLLFIVDGNGVINAAHAPMIFLVGVIFGPFCAWGAMWAADRPAASAKRSLSSILELASALALAAYLLAFAASLLGIPGF